jgi:pterin-4a-carbinolamine dehydratase
LKPFTFFISYRRVDTAPVALLLKHEIEKRLEFVRVFVDVESLEIGEDFPQRIAHFVDTAGATIILIGDRWMRPKGEKISSQRTDYVAMEVVASMTRPVIVDDGSPSPAKRVIIPVFINRERSFSAFEIPKEVRAITTLNAERLDYASWPDSIGPFIEKLAVRLNLKERPDADSYPPKDGTKARTQPVADDELGRILGYKDFDGWYLDNFGNSDVRYLVKTFRFDGFNKAAEFMRVVSDHCKVLDHHPEWRNVYDHVTVSLTTWDARRQVTIYDLNLALFMNRAAEAVKRRGPA